MTRYIISYRNPTQQFLTIEFQFEHLSQENPIVYLPTWRPGRYEIQHFAKRIRKVRASTSKGEALAIQKKGLSSWEIEASQPQPICITYEYYAGLMDAGNTWLDEAQLYVNFINCLMYTAKSRETPCEVVLHLPDDYTVASGLEKTEKHHLFAPNYNLLVDSPMFASNGLRQVVYGVNNRPYTLWFQGNMPQTDEALILDFSRFTKKTLEIMGDLPCDSYHFLFQILPYKHYHGVEHWNSTVITIGPEEALAERERYVDFLGVSCHELFHTWNVIRLRPQEMTPYDFQHPNVHQTGFITEGVTTYYGDLILARSGVYCFEEYMAEVNKLLKRHFENEGRQNYSVAESSFDLWLDGYEKGIPGRKVSIYNEGALAAMILDLSIREKFDNRKSLDDVMRLMWARHGQNMSGYTWEDYQKAAEEVFEGSLDSYFEQIIFGSADYGEWLFPLLQKFRLEVIDLSPENQLEREFGFRSDEQIVYDISEGSPAAHKLMLKDKVIQTNINEKQLHVTVERQGKQHTIFLAKGAKEFFVIPQVSDSHVDIQNDLLRGWLEECVE